MIYLDNNATTFADPRIIKRYEGLLREPLGNPHSMHAYGRKARQVLIEAKKRIADWFNLSSHQLIITSGATEALHLAIRSCSGHLITSSLEHAAVREAVNALPTIATRLAPLPGKGSITAEQIAAALRPDTKMIVISAANGETGICSDLEAIATLAERHDLLLVIDAVAFIGKEKWQMPSGRVAIAVSGHKIHAPLGVGALLTSRNFPIKPQLVGGGQQRGLRGGTEMVALTDALAYALECIDESDIDRMHSLRENFESQLAPLSPMIHGKGERRVSNVCNVAFPHQDGEIVLMKLDLAGIAASHGSACQSGAMELSHVLINMGLPKEIVRGSLRFSLSRYTTQEEIDYVVKLLTRTVLTPVSPISCASRSSSPIEI